jgi:TorA maturation chaperone TorD
MVANETQTSIDLAARRIVAQTLAAALADPASALGSRRFELPDGVIRSAWSLIADSFAGLKPADLGLGELQPDGVDIVPLVAWLRLDPARRAGAFVRVFGLVISKQCPAYETEYLPWKDSTHRAQKLADIAGFYRAFGLTPDSASPERPDHIALELEYVAFLLQKQLALELEPDAVQSADAPPRSERAGVCRDALAAFVADHIAWWVPTFGRCVLRQVERSLPQCTDDADRDALTLLAGVARVLCAWVAAERITHAVPPVRKLIGPEVPAPQLAESVDESCGECVDCAPVDR